MKRGRRKEFGGSRTEEEGHSRLQLSVLGCWSGGGSSLGPWCWARSRPLQWLPHCLHCSYRATCAFSIQDSRRIFATMALRRCCFFYCRAKTYSHLAHPTFLGLSVLSFANARLPCESVLASRALARHPLVTVFGFHPTSCAHLRGGTSHCPPDHREYVMPDVECCSTGTASW